MEKILLCWSSGKDSALALYELQRSKEYRVVSLLTTITETYDRISLHGVSRALLRRQVTALGLPLTEVDIPPEASDDEYGTRMRTAPDKFQQAGVNNVAFGDIHLADVRQYREDNLDRIGMRGVFPLWGRESAVLTQSFIDLGFRAVTTCVDTRTLDTSFAGRIIDNGFLDDLPPGVDPAGENGEFHSFAYGGPVFRQTLHVRAGEKVQRGDFCFCDLMTEEADCAG